MKNTLDLDFFNSKTENVYFYTLSDLVASVIDFLIIFFINLIHKLLTINKKFNKQVHKLIEKNFYFELI